MVESIVELVSNGDVSALVEEAGAAVTAEDVDCPAEVENSIVLEVATVLGSAVEENVAAEVEAVSSGVGLLGLVLRAAEVVCAGELRGRAEVVAEIGLVSGEEDDVCAGGVLVTVVSVASAVTRREVDFSAGVDWIGVVAEAFRLELSAVLDTTVELVTSGDVSGRVEEAEAVD